MIVGIRAEPTPGPTGFEDGINSAILRYSGAAEAEPTDDTVESTNPLDENALVVRLAFSFRLWG